MARKITPQDLQHDVDAMLTLCLQIADSKKFSLTGIHLAAALESLQKEREIHQQGLLSQSAASANLMSRSWFTDEDTDFHPPGAEK